MRRAALPLIGLVCSLALLGACYRAVLFEGGQFAYRDAAHFYYPLYLRVQQEWSAGRWPLWDTGQNGGMPLLGNPMAAVLYPGKACMPCSPMPGAPGCTSSCIRSSPCSARWRWGARSASAGRGRSWAA